MPDAAEKSQNDVLPDAFFDGGASNQAEGNRVIATLDQQADVQVALLSGMLEAMRKPTTKAAFKTLKDRFSDRSFAISLHQSGLS